MKVTGIIAALILLIGSIFKLMHWPGGNLMFLIGTVSLFLLNIVYCIKNINSNTLKALLPFTFAIWLVYFLFRIFHWSFGGYFLGFAIIFIVPFVITLFYFALLIKKGTFKVIHGLLALVFVLSIALGQTHSHQIYHTLNLRNSYQEYNYQSWDRYSWFLYLANEKEKALEANKKAEQAWNRCISSDKYAADNDYINIIKKNRAKISTSSWEQFRD